MQAVRVPVAQAWMKGDVEFITQHEADERVFTDPDGVLTMKADDLASLKSGGSKVASQCTRVSK